MLLTIKLKSDHTYKFSAFFAIHTHAGIEGPILR